MRRFQASTLLATLTFLTFTLVGLGGGPDVPKGTFILKKAADGASWSLKLDGEKFSVSRENNLGVEGTYKVSKDQLEITDEAGPFAEKGDQKTGTYRWTYADSKLTFTKVKDDAKGRSAILTSGAWELKKD